MTDKKISELTSLTGANVSDTNDVVAIVDSDQNTTKKITRAEFFKNVSSVDINGGTIDGVTIGGASAGAATFTDVTASGTINLSGTTVSNGGSVTTVDINGGTIDSTVIGGSTPAAVTGTTITATGDVDVVDKITHTGDTNTAIRFPAADTVTVETAGSERVRVNSSGNVGIGTISPSFTLDVAGNAAFENYILLSGNQPFIRIGESDDGAQHRIISANGDLFIQADGTGSVSDSGNLRLTGNINQDLNLLQLKAATLTVDSGGTERIRIDSSGNVGIGTSSPSEKLDVSGNVTISGSLSKGSGSFKIDHPIKPETHHLVHSFIEGPQADNIYRGKVALVDGTATVNLDEAGRMSEGTFVALNGNVQCFTTNEDGWTAVRGKVDGNILTIEAQDSTCTDTVSWLVIGERHDQHMIDANWTDEQGRIITEPEKETSQ
jgi:hypothetical protein